MTPPSIATDSAGGASADEIAQLYGPAWAPALAALRAELQDRIPAIVEDFYDYISQFPRAGQLIKRLAPDELAFLRAQKASNLLMLVDPNLTAGQHREMALRIGRIHATLGLARIQLLHSQDDLHSNVRNQVDTLAHGEALSVLTRRLIRDRAWQTEAHQNLQASRYDALLKITRLVWEVENYTDLIVQTAEILAAHGEIAACAFGRPDQQGTIHFESIAGAAGIKDFLARLETSFMAPAVTDDRPEGLGPTGRAWRTATVEHCLSIASDPSLLADWKSASARAGAASLAAIPLCPPGRPPLSLLILYSALPGGYAGKDQASFIAQLQALLVFALTRIEHLEGAGHLVPYAMRRHWSGLLHSGALEMHYQPLLELKTGRIAKIEALARLRDGDRMLAPGEFFPALSSDDFVELYVRGLRQALAQRNEWLADGLDLHLSINLPSSALGDPRYFNATRQALDEIGCTPHQLTLEILETEEIPPEVNVAGELARFKSLGVNLAEDDLGSGYSSLNRLRELPFDSIKIDRSIVTLAGQDGSNVLRFIYQLTRLGHSLGKQVIVEGVETDDLLEAITILGADIVQGYAIARPMPASEVMQWIRTKAQPAPPDLRRSHSVLAKLARLLIWEEQLHLLGGQASSPAAAAQPDLPLRTLGTNIQQALVDAAVAHGLRSPEYGNARRQLMMALTCAPSR